MANDEHVAILKKGAGPWNRWRDRTFQALISPAVASTAYPYGV
jgi:hypothetical protein